MKNLSTFIRRFLLFNKRLFKKPSFIAILLLIPMLILSLSIVSKNEKIGVMTIALALENSADPTADEIVTKLINDNSLINFIKADSPDAAIRLVESNSADASWIFPDNMAKKIADFIEFPSERNSFILIIQREDNVFLNISHEKLGAALFPYVSLALCEDYIYRNILSSEDISSAEIEEYYNSVDAEGADLFEFFFANSDNDVQNSDKSNYLTSPMRGLLAILVALSGIAVAAYYIEDQTRGSFDYLRSRGNFVFSICYHSTAVVDTALTMLIALIITGLGVGLWRELAAITLYIVITVGFSILLRLIVRDLRYLCALAPALIITMAVLCPIFINPPSLPFIQFLLPPYYYMNMIYNEAFFIYTVIYAVIIYSSSYILYRIKERK